MLAIARLQPALSAEAKLKLAKTFVLDVLGTTIQPIYTPRDDDFGVTFTDNGTTTTTPKFAPPSTLARRTRRNCLVRVEFWTSFGSGMVGTEDDGYGYPQAAPTLRSDGAIVVKQVEDLHRAATGLKHPKR